MTTLGQNSSGGGRGSQFDEKQLIQVSRHFENVVVDVVERGRFAQRFGSLLFLGPVGNATTVATATFHDEFGPGVGKFGLDFATLATDGNAGLLRWC